MVVFGRAAREARQRDEGAHVGRSFGARVEKDATLPTGYGARTSKGRLVFPCYDVIGELAYDAIRRRFLPTAPASNQPRRLMPMGWLQAKTSEQGGWEQADTQAPARRD